MHSSILLTSLMLASGALASVQILARNSCSTPDGSGKCGATSSCGGFSVAGYCPGDSSIQCCVTQSCSTSSGSGKCKGTAHGCSGGAFIAGACPGDSTIQCCVAGASPPTGGSGRISGLDNTQSAHAHAIMAQTHKQGLPRHACLAAMATSLTESNLLVYANYGVPESLNYPHDAVGSDYDSIGIFQQRAIYYTNIAADMDPAGSAAQFYSKMTAISGWQTMDVGTLCQEVQVSAYPDRYDDNMSEANTICNAGGF